MSEKSQIERSAGFRSALALSSVIFALVHSNAFAQEVRLLKIEVLSGEGAFNSIKDKRAKEVEIRVVDQGDRPVVGAAVVFQVPALGASATFTDGKTSFTTTTAEYGARLNRGSPAEPIEGRFNVAVTASYQGLEAKATVPQTNTLAGGQVGVSSASHKKYWILAIIGGAAAGGILATRSGGSTAASAPGSSVSVGAITVGVPR